MPSHRTARQSHRLSSRSTLRRTHRAVALTAVVLLALPVTGCGDQGSSADGAHRKPSSGTTAQPTAHKAASPTASGSARPADKSSSASSGAGSTIPVYWAGRTPAGQRLYREFIRAGGSDRLLAAARAVVGGTPRDASYHSAWPGGPAVGRVRASERRILVDFSDDAFTERPDGMTPRLAQLALQQLVYTLQGVQQKRLPVVFLRNGRPARLFGTLMRQPVTQASPLRTLSLMNITTPEEASTVSGSTLTVSGVANSPEANVVCELRRGDRTLVSRPFTAQGWMGDRLFPFTGRLPVAKAGSGAALLRCRTDDPSGGAEGSGVFTDDKRVTLR